MEKEQIILRYNYGFKWYHNKGIYVKGYIIDSNNILYKDEGLIDFFKDVTDIELLKAKMVQGKGLFSVIISDENEVLFAAVDQTRTFPLYYCFIDEKVLITDDAYYLKNNYSFCLNSISKEEFLYTGYVTGSETLLESVFQIESSEIICFYPFFSKSSYATYLLDSVEVNKSNNLDTELFYKLDESIKRLIRSVEGKTIVVPLSGGYDSRVIATLLRKNDYNNVICFSYGNRNGFQAKISEQVSNELNYPWLFVSYDEIEFSDKFIETSEFLKYYQFASNMVSVFLLQDFFAIEYLTNRKLIPIDSVIVPGHSGDFNVGNHLYPFDLNNISLAKIKLQVLKRHYLLKPFFSDKRIEDKLMNSFSADKLAYSVIENFNLKERQAKFIVNSVRVYEFFGYEHRMPFWDNDLVEFFRRLPFEEKLNSKLYFATIRKKLFQPYNVDIIPPDKNKNRFIRNIKPRLPIILTSALRSILHRRKQINTNVGYFQVLKPMISKYNIHSYIINGVLSEWIIRENFKE